MVASDVNGSNDILCYASSFDNKGAGIIIINRSNVSHNIEINLQHFAPADHYYWYLLTGGNDNRGFSRKVYVNGYGPPGVSGGPGEYADIPAYRSPTKQGIAMTVPAYGAVFMKTGRQ